MEISPLQRRVTFGLVVLVFVGLGAYLLGPLTHRSAPGPRRQPGPHPAVTSPAPQPAATSAAPPGSATLPDIYQWLPFTQAELAAAAATVRRFGNSYGTFSYTETAAAYVAPIAALTSSALAAQNRAAYTQPGVAAARTSARQVSAGSTVIQSLRAFGPSSLTFVVRLTENMTTASGRRQQVTSYAITLTGSASAWLVTDIELASAGNS